MTEAYPRAYRIHAVACAMVRALHHGRWHDARVDREARDNPTVRRLAEVALDAADFYNAENTGENAARISAAAVAYRLRFTKGADAAMNAMADALGFDRTVQM